MTNFLNLKNNLQQQLGPLYRIDFNPKNYLIVTSPITNEIGDNYRVFIHPINNASKAYGKYAYIIDDDGDALNEFQINHLKPSQASKYIKMNHGLIQDDMLVLHSQANNLIEIIFKHLRLQAGLTALQSFAEDEND